MKKIISVISFVLVIFSMFNFSAFAVEPIDETVGFVLSEEIIEQADGIYNTNENARATGLILQKTLTLSKTSTQLKITAKTVGSDEVTKSGFTYIKLQRLVNGSWTDYSTYCYEDLYSESGSYSFLKYITPPSGYSYRLVAEHYAAKKVLLIFTSDETSYNETSSIYF